ncbi:hypothetical protein L6452_01346 [Arctium lappa]|uniref:Uncharacterized protein n=1 Tax=Arctium lappa TaxID=4217 RepID=A0ACB9FGF4_ARCLA|nr:hypothetical protein L6452_01346 [Arctium lappa]
MHELYSYKSQEAIAIGRTFASLKDYQLDGNKEMVALGTMNIVGSMTSCYVTTSPQGRFSRSAVNYMAGCNTVVSNIVMSTIVMLTLLLITPLFKYTPNAILASIIISAVIGLIDFDAVVLLWKIDKFDFLAFVTDIDTSGIHALEELHISLQKREIQLIGEDKIFLTVADAVLTFAPRIEQA